jgi:uncharacterized protein
LAILSRAYFRCLSPALLALSLLLPARALHAADLRAKACDALRANVKEEKYLNHSRAVEAIMREWAAANNDDPDEWGVARLLHDIDIESTSTDLARHGVVRARILRYLGFSEAVVHAVNSHDDRPGVPRTSRLDHALYCADQVYWLILAAGLPYPSAEFNLATPAALREKAQSAPSKKPIMEKVGSEGALIGFNLVQMFQAAHAALRRLPPAAAQ